MKATELRIGNCVYQFLNDYAVHNIQIITSIGEKYVSTQEFQEVIPFSNVHPIPFDIKWAVRFKFEKEIELCLFLDNGLLFVFGNNNLCLMYEDDRVLITKIKSVHEFQNLHFALTGKEADQK